jgi:hypothetical protein
MCEATHTALRKAAKTIGLSIPQSFLLPADQVIE